MKDRLPLEDYLALTEAESLAERVEMFLMGRAARQLREFYPAHPARQFFDQPCHPSFLRSWHNHFDNYGNFMPGYCGGISLGTWRELDALETEGIDLDEHPILRFLISEDMRGLFHFAGEFGYRESPDGYVSKCGLCLEIREHLSTVGDFEELKPAEFYAQLSSTPANL